MSTPTRSRPGSNRRIHYLSPQAFSHPLSEEEIDAAIDQRIQAGQCRILERATDGLFTWQGNQLVAGPGSRRRRWGVGAGWVDQARPARELASPAR